VHVRCDGVGFSQLRSALAVAVVLVGSRLSLSAAAGILGSVTNARAVSRVLQRIDRSEDATSVWRAVEGLADQLDTQPPPIDYARRRSLSCHDLLPQSVWIHTCLSSGISPGRGLRLALARCWLYERITGLPGNRSQWAIDSPEFRSKLAGLPDWLNSGFITAADRYASSFLADQAIADEPIVWSPIPLPRRSDSRGIVQHANSHRAQVKGSRLLREIKLASGSVPPDLRRGLFAAATTLPKSVFEALYLEHHQSLTRIANRYGLSRQMTTRLAHSYGVALRPPGRQQRD
jgi:hypothetical protein